MTTHSTNAQQTIDPEFSPLACLLADCRPEQLLAVAWRDDQLVVIVNPGQKFVYTAQQIYAAGWRHGQLIRDYQPRPQPEPAPTTAHQIAALESVAAAHPGELAAAVINTPHGLRPGPTPEPHKSEPVAPTPEPYRDPAPARAWPDNAQNQPAKPAAYPAPAQPAPFPAPAKPKPFRPGGNP